jgi:hypothetical protein
MFEQGHAPAFQHADLYKTDELKVDNCNKSNYYILCRGYVFYTFYNSSYISEESIVILLNMDIYYYSTIEVMIMIILVCTTKYLLVFFGFSLNDNFGCFFYAPFLCPSSIKLFARSESFKSG